MKGKGKGAKRTKAIITLRTTISMKNSGKRVKCDKYRTNGPESRKKNRKEEEDLHYSIRAQ